MSAPWIHCETLEAEGELSLEADERRHLAARRVREGDAIVCFDACGRTADAELVALGKREARVRFAQVREVPRPARRFTLATAVPKGERLSILLQMLTQLGVSAWQPLLLDSSAVRRLDVDAARWRRIVVESCKVARRAWAPELQPLRTLDEVLVRLSPSTAVFGDREGQAGGPPASAEVCLIGPEAGFSSEETRRLKDAGLPAVSLAADNLRIETAAVAAAATHHAAWNLAHAAAPTKETP